MKTDGKLGVGLAGHLAPFKVSAPALGDLSELSLL